MFCYECKNSMLKQVPLAWPACYRNAMWRGEERTWFESCLVLLLISRRDSRVSSHGPPVHDAVCCSSLFCIYSGYHNCFNFLLSASVFETSSAYLWSFLWPTTVALFDVYWLRSAHLILTGCSQTCRVATPVLRSLISATYPKLFTLVQYPGPIHTFCISFTYPSPVSPSGIYV